MRKIILYLTIVLLIFSIACTDSVTPSNNPEVEIVGELSTQYVNPMGIIQKTGQIQEDEVDSIKIIRIRILMSEMKLFNESLDSTEGKILKISPFVYDLQKENEVVQITSASIPSGNYDKIKIEFHRFSSNEINQYQNDVVFKDFATSDRYSIIIEGITYKNDQPSIFTFNSQLTANLLLKFDPVLDLNDNSNTVISINMDPNFFMKKWESILDPNDPKNANDIENSLKNTIKANKKQ